MMETVGRLTEDLHLELHQHFDEVGRLAARRSELNNQLFSEYPELHQRVVKMVVTGRWPLVDKILGEYRTPLQQAELQEVTQQLKFHASQVATLWYHPQVQEAHQACLQVKPSIR